MEYIKNHLIINTNYHNKFIFLLDHIPVDKEPEDGRCIHHTSSVLRLLIDRNMNKKKKKLAFLAAVRMSSACRTDCANSSLSDFVMIVHPYFANLS